MNGSVSFHRLARLELNAAASYYEAQSPGLGLRFLDAVEHCVRTIIEFPNAGKTLRGEVNAGWSTASRMAYFTVDYRTNFGSWRS